MSMIFQFRALSDENDRFVRDYQIMYNSTLLDLHNHICEDLAYDDQAMESFFMSNRNWEKLQEYTLTDMHAGDGSGNVPVPMETVTMRSLLKEIGDRLIYTFDLFGERSLYLELTGAYKGEEGVGYPRTTLSEGEPPSQFSPLDDSGSIFDEAMDEFGGFEGDDAYDDEI